MVTTLYPEFPWEASKFKKTIGGYWKDINNQKKFLQKFSDDLHFSSWTDWYMLPAQVRSS